MKNEVAALLSLAGIDPSPPGQQRAAANLKERSARQAPVETVATATRAMRRRAALGVHRALVLALGQLTAEAVVEVAAWLSVPRHAAWMGEHIVDVVELNLDDERFPAAEPDVLPLDPPQPEDSR